MMLAAQTLTKLLQQWDCDNLESLPEELVRDQIPVVLTQILIRTLQAQGTDGSWAQGACEITAYAILSLVSIATLPWVAMLTAYTLPAIERGKQFLAENHSRWQEPCYTWVEKVTYSSTLIAKTYCLAAMKVSPPSCSWSTKLQDLTHIPLNSVKKFVQFYSGVLLFS